MTVYLGFFVTLLVNSIAWYIISQITYKLLWRKSALADQKTLLGYFLKKIKSQKHLRTAQLRSRKREPVHVKFRIDQYPLLICCILSIARNEIIKRSIIKRWWFLFLASIFGSIIAGVGGGVGLIMLDSTDPGLIEEFTQATLIQSIVTIPFLVLNIISTIYFICVVKQISKWQYQKSIGFV